MTACKTCQSLRLKCLGLQIIIADLEQKLAHKELELEASERYLTASLEETRSLELTVERETP